MNDEFSPARGWFYATLSFIGLAALLGVGKVDMVLKNRRAVELDGKTYAVERFSGETKVKRNFNGIHECHLVDQNSDGVVDIRRDYFSRPSPPMVMRFDTNPSESDQELFRNAVLAYKSQILAELDQFKP